MIKIEQPKIINIHPEIQQLIDRCQFKHKYLSCNDLITNLFLKLQLAKIIKYKMILKLIKIKYNMYKCLQF